MDKKRVMELRGRAQTLRATVRIGKDGLTRAVADELTRQLKKNKLVKIRLLQSYDGDMHEAGEMLARESSSFLVEVRGRTIVLTKE